MRLSCLVKFSKAFGNLTYNDSNAANDNVAFVKGFLKLFPQFPNDDAIIVTLNQAPFPVVYVNEPWVELCKYTSEDVLGRDCAFLQGPATDKNLVKQTVKLAARSGGVPAKMVVNNYKKRAGLPFRNEVTLAQVPNSPFMVARLKEVAATA